MQKYKFIVIEGNIGAGKTSLSSMIAEEFNAKLILEQFVDNPFLPKFYKDPEKYSFPLEMSFLAERYHQLKKELSHHALFQAFTVADYYFMKSLIFAQSTLPPDEYDLYRKIFNIIYNQLPKPDLYVYLYKSTPNLLSNIKKRGRDYEQDISAEYLTKLNDGYFNFFKNYVDLRFLVIDTNNIDFVNRPEDYKRITDAIFNNAYENGINRVTMD